MLFGYVLNSSNLTKGEIFGSLSPEAISPCSGGLKADCIADALDVILAHKLVPNMFTEFAAVTRFSYMKLHVTAEQLLQYFCLHLW